MTDLRLFLNRLRTLSAIDRDEFEQAVGVVSERTWAAFRDDPVKWFIRRLTDADQAALWRVMTGRFPG